MAEQGFTLTSPDFTDGGDIPSGLTCDGTKRPPKLSWMHAPEGTKSFVIIVDDPDAPDGTFVHWLAFDIPASVDGISPEADHTGVQGRNDYQQTGYGGPCPPPNHGKHRYRFHLYAADIESLDLEEAATREEVEQAVAGHILDETMLTGLYERRTG
jgi:Raf kinase inhibitor-like YbhB/YbcL family protein